MEYYHENMEALIDRYRALSSDAYEGALVTVYAIDETGDRVKIPPVRPLNQWDFDTELFAFMDAHLAAAEACWEARSDLDDDSIPAICPRFGIAEHSAYLGGEVVMEKDTSYHSPIVKDWDDIDKIHVDPNNKWFRYLMDAAEYIQEKARGKMALYLRGGMCPCDLANILRGNDLFTDFYDSPEEVHRLLNKCTEVESWFIAQQMKVNQGFFGGVVDGNSVWIPKNSFGHLTEDWSSMCSPAMYAEFGAPYTRRLLEPLDCAMMHVHGLGAHILPQVCAMDKIHYIQITQDPNQPCPVEFYKKYEKELENKVVLLWMNWEDVEENLDFLRGKRVIFQLHTKTFQEAKAVTELIHRELPIRKKVR